MTSDTFKTVEEIKRKINECERLYKEVQEVLKIVAKDDLTPAGIARAILHDMFSFIRQKEQKPVYIEENDQTNSNS